MFSQKNEKLKEKRECHTISISGLQDSRRIMQIS